MSRKREDLDMDYLYEIDNPISIEEYAKRLVGKTFLQVIEMGNHDEKHQLEIIEAYGNRARKGGLGNLLEEEYFGYKANGNSEADFSEAGVELKATPYEIKKNGELKAGERLVLGMISYEKPIETDFFKSHMWEKSQLLLLIYYFRNKQLNSNLLYSIDYVKLFTPPKEDLDIIIQDYKIIADKVRSGKAHELSESDTMYLGACTKGATAEKSTVPQYYAPSIPARKRAFCYKLSYMTYVLNNYIVTDKVMYEPIVKDKNVLKNQTFEEYIKGMINEYVGKSDKELCKLFDREYNNNKSQWIDLAYRMLGVKSSKAEEFEKANIVIKSIRIEKNGKMRESISFPPFLFKDFVQECFEESELYNYFEETRFFFVVWQKKNNDYVLKGCQLWNMPYSDLNITVRREWENIKHIVEYGVSFTKKKTKKGYVIQNSLPGKKENEIIHIRPHSKRSAYKFADGEIIGNIKRDANELPNGEYMTTQSFWINNDYFLKQLKC